VSVYRSVLASILLPCVATLAASGGPVSAKQQRQGAAHFLLTQEGGGLCCSVSERVTFSLASPDHSWIIERRRRDVVFANETSVHDWAASKDCPVLNEIMTELPKAQKRDREQAPKRKLIYVTDTPLFTLTALGKGTTKSHATSEWRGPLVDWWASASERLKPCWKDYPAA